MSAGAFWQNVTRFQTEKIAPWLALRNALGVTLPLAAGVALDAVPVGLAVSTGALNVSFSDSEDPYLQRGRRMLATSVLVGIAVFVGALCGENHVVTVIVAAAWAFAAGILVAVGTAAADMGVISLVTVVVFSAGPMPAQTAVHFGLLAFAGGLLQTIFSLALWPVRRYRPERRALGAFYLELSRTAASPVQTSQAPPASAQGTEAQTALAALGRDHSIEGERYRSLLTQAERMRLSLLALARLRARMRRENETSAEAEILDRCFEISSHMLSSIGNSLLGARAADAAPELPQELNNLSDQLREANQQRSSAVIAMVMDARFQVDALAGQLRSAVDLSAYATPEGATAFKQREARQPWSLRLGGTLATLRANLTLDSAACRHALRLAACVALGDALARSLDWRRSYWLPMTVAIVLKPDFTATFSRGVLRLAGTFAGLLLATALFHVLPAGTGAEVVLIALLMFVLRCFGSANYGIFVTAVTALVVLLFAVTGVAPKGVMAARGMNTAVGGAIALIAYWLWPTWERNQVSEALARMLDAYRAYFRAIREAYVKPDTWFAHEVERTRVAARLARSNLEASVDRLSAEPGASDERMNSLGAMLASSHRLVHAMMALEAGLSRSRPVPPREAFFAFANHVEFTFYYLAAALRGSALARRDLPDLREDHHALIESGDPLTERYALVNVETDRITNSLNTLGEEVLQWIALQGQRAA